MEFLKERLDDKKYLCSLCDFNTTKLNHWNRHIKTLKHTNKIKNIDVSNIINLTFSNIPNEQIKCDNCNMTFKSRTSLWRHLNLNKCENNTNNSNSNILLLNEVIKQSQDFFKENQKQTLDFVKEIVKSHQTQNEKLLLDLVDKKTNITKSNRVTNHNNNININFTNNIVIQLNEKFPDALTMNDFLNTIQNSLGDLTKMPSKPAFIDQVTSIFCNKISELETKERPLHFIQENGLNSFYIKENGEWEQKTKDDMDKQLKNTAHRISKIRNDQWEEKLNSGTCTEKDQDSWTRYVKHVTTDITEQDIDRSLQKIKKSVQLNKKELIN
jgi:hypothetical protein